MNNVTLSPFHSGERLIQEQFGVGEQMEHFGQKVIRNYMPDQHRKFYQQLPYLLVGHVDSDGWPWASILTGDAGFIQSPDNKHLHIQAQPILGDPLAESAIEQAPLGLLGIDLSTRRRNRLSGHISKITQQGIELEIDQAFGNCPKYIQKRTIEKNPISPRQTSVQPLEALDLNATTLIANSDTFFVSSYIANNSGQPSDGADISHRGGKPGFVRIDNEHKLTIPDYSGNFHFNTLGNFIENPKAGLLFIDFEQGHLLMLTGTVEILWDSAETKDFDGAERLWTFQLKKGLWLNNALPVIWQLQEYSRFL